MRFGLFLILCFLMISSCASPFSISEPSSTINEDPTVQVTVNPTAPEVIEETPEPTSLLDPSTATPEPTALQDPIINTPEPIPPTEVPPTEAPTLIPTEAEVINQSLTPSPGFIRVDRNSIDLFEHIPEEYLEIARNTKMVFVDRSVGQNINEALDCLAAPSWSEAPSYCRRDYVDENWNWKTFTPQEYQNNAVPTTILFEPDPVKYDRSNWTFQVQIAGWEGVVQDFIEVQVPAYFSEKEVLSYQFNYFHIDEGSTIDGETRADGRYYPGFFDADPGNPDRWDISDLEALEEQYPDKTFIYWTTSLARLIGSKDGEIFNDQMRAYAFENGKILFDVADIESHDPSGNACYDSRDGVCYCNRNKCEDYSIYGESCDWDDGQDYLAICQNYTTETLGGHLGSVSGGKIRIAKAFWVLMAQIAGWDGNPG